MLQVWQKQNKTKQKLKEREREKERRQPFREDNANRRGLSPSGTRVFVLLLVLVSILWIPVVQASQGGHLFIYIQSISSYLQPPVAVVFIMGCFWKRTNEKVALEQPFSP